MPANARTSNTSSFLTSALTIESCSWVSREVNEPRSAAPTSPAPSTRRGINSRYPAAASRCASREALGSTSATSSASTAPRVQRDGTVSAMASSEINSVRSSLAQ